MKNHLFRYIIIIVFFSCDNNQKTDVKLKNTGSDHEVIIVTDDQIWDGEKGRALKNIFQKEIEGLPQSEQSFNLIQINPSEFNRIFETHKNIIFISIDTEDSYTQNKWSEDQIVIYLSSMSNEETFEKNCNTAFNFIEKKELESIKSSYKQAHNTKARKFIKDEFGIDIYLPTEYSVPIEGEGIFVADFHSFNEQKDLLKYIIVFDISHHNKNFDSEVLHRSDSILSLYIPGEAKNSFVEIDKRVQINEKNGIYRGMWRLKNGFMAGPLIIKTYDKTDKTIVTLGLIFYPNENKRKFIKTLEAFL